jgi:uncharacterized membrane protein YwaF
VAMHAWLVLNGGLVGLRQFGLKYQWQFMSRFGSLAMAGCRRQSLGNFLLVMFWLRHQWLLYFFIIIILQIVAKEGGY